MENTLSWSPGLKLSDYENFAIRNALKYTKGDLRQVSNILEISPEELSMKLSSLEIEHRQTLGEIGYWRQHKRISERFLNGVISKEEFDQEIAELGESSGTPMSTVDSFTLPDQALTTDARLSDPASEVPDAEVSSNEEATDKPAAKPVMQFAKTKTK